MNKTLEDYQTPHPEDNNFEIEEDDDSCEEEQASRDDEGKGEYWVEEEEEEEGERNGDEQDDGYEDFSPEWEDYEALSFRLITNANPRNYYDASAPDSEDIALYIQNDNKVT